MKEIHDLFVTWGHDDVLAWAAAKGRVLSMALIELWESVLIPCILLLVRVMQPSAVWAITCDHVGVKGICPHRGH